jgi:hypothetical protein
MYVYIMGIFNGIPSRNYAILYYFYMLDYPYHNIYRMICLYLSFRKTIDLLRRAPIELSSLIFRGLPYEEIIYCVWSVSFIGRYAGWV